MNEATISLQISAEDIAYLVAQATDTMLEACSQYSEEEKKEGFRYEVPNELYWKDPEASSSVVSLKRKKAENNMCFICMGEFRQARTHPVMLDAIQKAKNAGFQLDIDATWIMYDQRIERDHIAFSEKGEAFLLSELHGLIAQDVNIKLTPFHYIEEEKDLPPFLQKLDDVLS